MSRKADKEARRARRFDFVPGEVGEDQIRSIVTEHVKAGRLDPSQVEDTIEKSKAKGVWISDTYQVAVYDAEASPEWPAMWHLSIKRRDKHPIHDWRDLQEIKNRIVGPEFEAVELYPAESRLVDVANQYHLFVLKEQGLTFPFGFKSRLVSDTPLTSASQQRHGAQRGEP
ncbi:MAG: hypothetical protein P1V51_20190 [Deltaproteobacteria bacterium]|nr:hypothetical protein [Deltaproteobacteria bacterium]